MATSLSVDKTTATVVDFLEWQRQGSLDLKPYYQRRSTWNPRVKSLLIDSMLRGYPLPLIFLHNRLDVAQSKTVRQVVDGQQRLRTILAYIDPDCLNDLDDWDNFTVLRSHNSEFAGLGFTSLPENVQARILQTPLSVNVLPSDINDVTVLTIFQRMNSTGLKLNDQEIRNATFFGDFKDSAYRLAYRHNQRWQEWGIFSRQDVAQMKEVEATADLMGFLVDGIQARTKARLTNLFRRYDDAFPEREAVESRIDEVFTLLDSVYGAGATRSTLKRFRTSAWFYSVFAVAAESSATLKPGTLVSALELAETELRTGSLDEGLQRVLRGATADRVSRSLRIGFLQKQLSKAANVEL